jgi:chemotaxis protein CheC
MDGDRAMKGFHELNALELDTIREIGSIGTGNAATALSGMLGSKVSIEMPQVRIMGYNEAIDWIGGPEAVTAGVLVHLEGEINGIMLCVQQMDFVNLMLERMVGRRLDGYEQLKELDVSALLEVGNIMISAFVNALAGMTDMTIRLTVPAFAVDMQGAILAVPMAEFGGQSDYLMTIGTQFVCEGHAVPCRLLLSPDVRSLNFLLKRLGVLDER